MAPENIIFEQIRSGGCLSYLLGCLDKKKCVVIDPELDKADEYVELAKFFSSELLYAIDTHTHADHNSACKILREKHAIQVIMHRTTDTPYIDIGVEDGELIEFGAQSLKVVYTPGHTQDAMCLLFRDRIFTGDTLLIGGCGRTDLPGGSPELQYDSLRKLRTLGDEIRVYPGHDYREAVSTLGDEKQNNARMLIPNEKEFVHFMTSRKPPLPRKIEGALEWNRTPIQGTQRGMGEGI
ncbi:MAG: MBL fold metallo-hydrolase [Deltaproteobacteria bacterium]|nr:MBL fold metallo-hydrolase [Deltaproteobacteria bacterium]